MSLTRTQQVKPQAIWWIVAWTMLLFSYQNCAFDPDTKSLEVRPVEDEKLRDSRQNLDSHFEIFFAKQVSSVANHSTSKEIQRGTHT